MRGRFGRRRNGGDGAGSAPALDAARELAQARERGWVSLEDLEPVEAPEVPAHLAAVGLGRDAAGARILVALSPRRGGDAWLAALAVGARLAREGAPPHEAWALSTRWPAEDRARLGLVREGGLRVRALQPAAEGRAAAELSAEPAPGVPAVRLRGLAAGRPAPVALLLARAARALAGLAAKHGGDVRLGASGVELVLLARPVARLVLEGEGVSLVAQVPKRSVLPVTHEQLSDSLDRLEGFLRKHLNERRNRDSEEALRSAAIPALAAAAGSLELRRWPIPGADPDPVDAVGVGADGRTWVGAVRRELGLEGLGAVLDGWLHARPVLPAVLAREALAPAPPRLLLGAERWAPGVDAVLGILVPDTLVFDLEVEPSRLPGLRPRATQAPAAPAARAAAPAAPPAARAPSAAVAGPAAGAAPAPEAPSDEARAGGGFEELSVFELAEEGGEAEAGEGRRRRRRRGRGRGRGRRGAAREGAAGEGTLAGEAPEVTEADESPEEGAAEPEAAAGIGVEGPAPELEPAPEAPEPEPPPRRTDFLIDEDELVLGDLAREAGHDLGATRTPARSVDLGDFLDEEPAFDDEEDEELEEDALARAAEEREARRRARLAKTEPEPEPAEAAARRPRRRAALLLHADRDSVGAGVVLARDLRLVEGIWIYPQSELMTFFRSVATDLREDTPIYVVGFAASPARETLQAASVYQGRLTWIDHHDWPPEDLGALRSSLGEESVLVEPGLGSSLPLVLSMATRRSRFTDKLVDLLTGRFTEHDFTRWGRLWWHRLGDIATRRGEQRAALEPLLQGRPSDLAREAARVPAPPPPPEAEHVASHDFRLVHFGGLSMVLVPLPAELDVALGARVARARYDAPLSLAWHAGDDRFVLAADDVSGRRSLDVGAMGHHLGEKFAWVQDLGDADHVARFRILGLADHPERLEAVVGEIAMGRSILEA